MKRVLLYISIALTAIGCTKDPDILQSGDNALTITSNIASRAEKSQWGEDTIGVYVTPDGGDFGYSGSNIAFTTNGDGNFTSSTPIHLPSGESKVLAYYPWVNGINYAEYPIDSEDQVDLLSAIRDNVTSPFVELTFKHRLSKISFTIKEGDGLEKSNLADLEVKLSGISTTANFDLEHSAVSSLTNSNADLALVTTAEGTSSSAIVIPQSLSGATLSFKTKDYGTFSATLSTGEFKVGNEYKYTATLNRSGVEITEANIDSWNEITDSGTANIVDIEYKSDGKYYINSAKGLAAFRDLVYGAGSNTRDATFAGFDKSKFESADTEIDGVLTRDIDLVDVCYDGGASWIPIGRFYQNVTYAYAGYFDGGGHKVSGLYINATSQQALFGYVHADGVVCNLGVAGKVTGYYLNSNTGEVSSQTAGLAANNYGNIFNCYSEVEVSGQRNVGGIAAHNTGSVVNCYNHGNVTSTFNNAGGIVGYNVGGYVGYCYNTGKVELNTSEDDARHGGVVGYNNPGSMTGDSVKGSFCLNNTDFSIGQVGGNTSTGTLNTNVCYDYYLTSETFATTMNNGAATYNNNYNSKVDACAWVYNSSGYLTHDFYKTPQYTNLDIIYNSIDYTINTAKGLQAFAALVNGEVNPGAATSGDDVFFQFGTPQRAIGGRLSANIELDSETWTPIGSSSENTYSGTFDGKNKTVSGVTAIISEGDNSGMFRYVSESDNITGITLVE